MRKLCAGLALLCFVVPQGRSQPPQFDHGLDLPTTRPLNVGHRGNCGVYPDHTLPGYQSAVDAGADVIECDVCVTRDLRLVCLHESWLSDTTNIADVYPEDRMNTYFVIDSGRLITDYFTVDFTLDELKLVGAVQRFDYRDPHYDGEFPITTLEEYIQVAQNAGRPVGIYIEPKSPVWVNSLDFVAQANTTIEDLLIEEVTRYGYTGNRDPCLLHSFNEDSSRYMAANSALPVVMAISTGSDVSDERLDSLAEFCYGILVNRRLVVTVNINDQITGRTDLIERAHARGLRVHAYTMKNEDRHLPWDYKQDYNNEFQDFLDLQCDGLSGDFPASYHDFLEKVYRDCDQV